MTVSSNVDFDVIIVGSGPAGVSAAFPLVDAGLRVLMVDGGRDALLAPPRGQFLDVRLHDKDQWNWMVGRDFYALQQLAAISPKLRAPTHAAVFEGFNQANRIRAKDFVAVGSLAPGGLSNAWGCGVACLTDEELTAYPVTPAEMRTSYASVARRIGLSGGCDDDLSEFFGLDMWSQPPVPIDELQGYLQARYAGCRETLIQGGFRLGRARLATLTEPLGDRKACDLSGTCLWGCDRRALYSATEDLRLLRGRAGFHYRPGFLVERVSADSGIVTVEGQDADGGAAVLGRRVFLAAGTLASSRLALQSINHRKPVSMQSCPTAAFMLWLPRNFGRTRSAAFGLGQLAFTLDFPGGAKGYGALFDTTGIPVTEFSRFLPLGKRASVDLLEPLLTSCVVGNMFLPGEMTQTVLRLDDDDSLLVHGSYRPEVAALLRDAHRRLRANFWKLGAVLLPASFRAGRPGSDIHYAASMPMRAKPVRGQTNSYGELEGANGIHMIDGASLSFLPAKPHTLTIMANADRIARHVSRALE